MRRMIRILPEWSYTSDGFKMSWLRNWMLIVLAEHKIRTHRDTNGKKDIWPLPCIILCILLSCAAGTISKSCIHSGQNGVWIKHKKPIDHLHNELNKESPVTDDTFDFNFNFVVRLSKLLK